MKAYRITTFAALSFLLVLSLVSLSLGWLTNYIRLDSIFDFSAGSPEDFLLYEITYSEDAEGNFTRTFVEDKETVGTEGFEISNLQFGTMNNLSSLKPSNYVYYAVRVPKKNGNNITLSINYGNDEDHFEIYVPVEGNDGNVTYEKLLDDDPNTETSKLDLIKNIETVNSQTFITYSYVITTAAPTETYPSLTELEALFADKEEQHMNSTAAISLTDEVASLTGDYYYVYIRLCPNISLYKYFIDYLWDSMPFYLAYDVHVAIDVR
jgi:hypothetical protein